MSTSEERASSALRKISAALRAVRQLNQRAENVPRSRHRLERQHTISPISRTKSIPILHTPPSPHLPIERSASDGVCRGSNSLERSDSTSGYLASINLDPSIDHLFERYPMTTSIMSRFSPAKFAFEVSIVFAVLTISLTYHRYGIYAWIAHTLILGWGGIWVDRYISPTMQNNFQQLQAYGYSPRSMWMLMFMNLVGSNSLVTVINNGFGCFDVEPRIDLKLIIGLATMVMAEVTFAGAHYWLHRSQRGGEYHKLHHCCRPCSWSTNLLFHSIDLALEFSGPFIAMVTMQLLLCMFLRCMTNSL